MATSKRRPNWSADETEQMKMVVKNKASGLKMEINKTGGGMIPDSLQPGASDERILSVIGKVCFEGVESGMDLNEILLKRMSGVSGVVRNEVEDGNPDQLQPGSSSTLFVDEGTEQGSVGVVKNEVADGPSSVWIDDVKVLPSTLVAASVPKSGRKEATKTSDVSILVDLQKQTLDTTQQTLQAVKQLVDLEKERLMVDRKRLDLERTRLYIAAAQ